MRNKKVKENPNNWEDIQKINKIMISNLSPLLSKALFTSEFIGLKRVLSDQQIPYQALMNL